MIAAETASVCVDGRDKPGHDGKSHDGKSREGNGIDAGERARLAPPAEGTQTAQILRLARQGVAQKQIAAQTGSSYAYVGVVIGNLRRRGLLAPAEKIWSDDVLDALRVAVVEKGMYPADAAAHLSAQFGRPFNRNMVNQVALRRGWKAGAEAVATDASRAVVRKRVWPDEIIAAMRRLLEVDQLTAGDAAARLTERFGANFGEISRNAVIGKAARLGVRIAAKRDRAPRRVLCDAPPSKVQFTEIVADDWSPRRLTLLELRPGDCRFPLGDPRSESFVYCGAPTEEGKSYCLHCYGVSYESPAKRAARRRAWREARGLAPEGKRKGAARGELSL